MMKRENARTNTSPLLNCKMLEEKKISHWKLISTSTTILFDCKIWEPTSTVEIVGSHIHIIHSEKFLKLKSPH